MCNGGTGIRQETVELSGANAVDVDNEVAKQEPCRGRDGTPGSTIFLRCIDNQIIYTDFSLYIFVYF